jgi:hypothetical protein
VKLAVITVFELIAVLVVFALARSLYRWALRRREQARRDAVTAWARDGFRAVQHELNVRARARLDDDNWLRRIPTFQPQGESNDPL